MSYCRRGKGLWHSDAIILHGVQARGTRHYWISVAISFNIGAIVALFITNVVFPWCVPPAATGHAWR